MLGLSHDSAPPAPLMIAPPVSAPLPLPAFFSPPIAAGQRSKRVVGNSTVVCNCCIFPKHSWSAIIVAAAVLFPVVVFLTTVSHSLVSLAVVLSLTAGTLAMLFLAVAIDPGILVPLPYDPQRREEKVVVNNAEIICKVCTTCNIVRPPRSGHCAHCDYCVEEFDHHCGVLGSCVAKRTFRFFAGFMYFTAALAGFIFAQCCYHLSQMDISGTASSSHAGRWEVVASFGCIFYAGIGGTCVAGNAFYYGYLGCVNSTQKEQLGFGRRGFVDERNPFDRGYCSNFVLRFCGPLGRSALTQGDLRGRNVVNA
jgi:hypothetical protein